MSDSAVRALEVLEHVASAAAGMSAAEVARDLKMSRATVARLLTSMERSGWLMVDGQSHRYVTSLRLVTAGAAALRHNRVRQQLRPWLIMLAERTGEPCALCFYRDGHLTVTDVTETVGGRTTAQFDAYTFPAACTAAGKILLAFATPDELERVARRGIAPFTEFTITEPERILEDIRATRERGYALSDRQFTTTTSAIAVPVFDRPGHAVAALGVNQPGELTPGFISAVAPVALSLAALASSGLSGSGPNTVMG